MYAYRLLLVAAALCVCTATGTSSDYYRVVRKDFRRCAVPLCGGYFVQKVNVNGERYVGSLQLSHLGQKVLQPYNSFLQTIPGSWASIVYAGYLVNNKRFPEFPHIRDLYVTTIYIGYPGVNVTLGHNIAYYSISQSGPTIRASLLNKKSHVSIDGGKVRTFAPIAIADQPVQRKQILAKGALVIATIRPPNVFARQVFFKIPVVADPCPLFKIACNSPPDVVGYTRTDDLCFTPKCIKQKDIRFCPLWIPLCSAGYRLVGWTGLNGCNTYACDPIFFPNATQFDYPVINF